MALLALGWTHHIGYLGLAAQANLQGPTTQKPKCQMSKLQVV